MRALMRDKRRSFYGAAALLLLLTPVIYRGYAHGKHWYSFQHLETWEDWTVTLPQGGTVRYLNQSPPMRPVIGPADTTKSLQWTSLNGERREYVLSFIGSGYRDLEIRLLQNRRGLWLIDRENPRVLASLDLSSGDFYSADAAASEDEGLPDWATLQGGASLGRRKFH